MQRLLAGVVFGLAATALTLAPAQAHGKRGQGWGHHGGYVYADPYYYGPPPVVVVPPPRVIYAQPRVIYAPPVVVAPRPIYVAPRPIYVPPPTVGFGFRIGPNAHGFVSTPIGPGTIYAPPGRVVYGW